MSRKKTSPRRVSARYAENEYVYRGLRYAEDIVAGKIPAGKYTILACERQLKDLKKRKFDYVFDPVEAEVICQFVELLPHAKGQWASRKELIRLEDWQCFAFTTAFGWLRKKDRKRRFREINIYVPRKNGKSLIAGGIGLYMLCDDGEHGAEVYSGATTEKQAWEVFRPAKQMAQRTPDLLEAYGVDVMAKALSIAANGSRFEPVIGDPGDGSSPSCAIIDEYHEHKSPAMFDTMQTGMGAREQPIMLVITTAGSNLGGPCYGHQRELEKILEGVIDGDDRFAIIYHADIDDDWADPAALIKANPNYGVSIDSDFLLTRQREAAISTAKQNIFRTKHLNQWVSARQAFFNMIKFRQCADTSLRIEDFEGQTCIGSIDLASKSDLAVYLRMFPMTGDDGRLHYYAFPIFYLPEDAVLNDKSGNYQAWMHEGRLTVTGGNEIDFSFIRRDVIQDLPRFRFKELPYDPWRATQFAQELSALGAPMVEFNQSARHLSEPMKELEAAVNGGRFHYDGCPILTWNASNVVAKVDAKDNVFPRKEGDRTENKIDGIVAAIMAVGRSIHAEEQGDIDGFLANPIVI